MSDFCLTQREGNLFIITINRPEVMNSLHPPANRAMAAAFDEFATSP